MLVPRCLLAACATCVTGSSLLEWQLSELSIPSDFAALYVRTAFLDGVRASFPFPLHVYLLFMHRYHFLWKSMDYAHLLHICCHSIVSVYAALHLK